SPGGGRALRALKLNKTITGYSSPPPPKPRQKKKLIIIYFFFFLFANPVSINIKKKLNKKTIRKKNNLYVFA
ncbi:hypothetical protein, partial [Enterobacter intestinihominis]